MDADPGIGQAIAFIRIKEAADPQSFQVSHYSLGSTGVPARAGSLA